MGEATKLGHTSGARLWKAWVALAIAGLVLGAAVGVRYFEPSHLRKATSSVVRGEGETVQNARRLEQSRASLVADPGRRLVFVGVLPTGPPAPSVWAPIFFMLGALALGVAVPKRRRWAVLGGHGRNGVG